MKLYTYKQMQAIKEANKLASENDYYDIDLRKYYQRHRKEYLKLARSLNEY